MGGLGERLSEDICKIGRTCDLVKNQKTLSNLLMNEEVAELDVLCIFKLMHCHSTPIRPTGLLKVWNFVERWMNHL